MKQLILWIGILMTLTFSACNTEKTDNTSYVVIETEFGNMRAKLYDFTPIHKENFIKLAKENFYEDLLFHRVMNEFMIQGGDPDSKGAAPNARLGNGGPGYTLDAEIAAPHFKGTLAAARTGDSMNPQRKSSGSQFYVVHGKPVTDEMLNQFEQRNNIKYNEAQRAKYKEVGGAPFLDGQYTVFGEVVEGFEVIDKIAAVPVGGGSRPTQDVKMKVRMD